MNSTAEVESDHHEHHDNHRLRKNAQLKALMKASSSSRKKISSKEIQLNPTSKSKKRLHHKAHRLAKTHIDPVTAAIIVKYTAAVITKILDYGTAKVKEFTKAVYQKTLNQIDSSKNQWRIMLETQCFFFRMIRQITKVYLMSSDYEHYMLTRSGYAPLKRTVDKINDVREKILNFIDQKVIDSCGEVDNYLIDYMQMADGKKKEIEDEIKKLSEDHLNTSVNSLDYVIKQIKKNGPPQLSQEPEEQESKFKKVVDIFSDELENVNNINEDLNGEGNGWKDLMDSQEDKGVKLSGELGLGERADFIKEYNENLGDFLGKTVGILSKLDTIRKEVTDSLSEEDSQIIGQQAADMEKMRKYVSIAVNVFSIVSKIVEWSGNEMPEWGATLEAAFELLEKYLKYKSLVYTRRFVTLNKETKRVLDEEILKCKTFELIPAGVKLAALFTGSVALGVLRAVVGPFLDAAINVFKMLVSVYKLVSAIVGYFRAKRETKEVEQLLTITTENIEKHYSYEKCSATEQLYEMLKILEDEKAESKRQAEKMQKDVSKTSTAQDDSNKKLKFMQLAVNDDVNIFLSSFSSSEIKSAETTQSQQTNQGQFSLTEKIFYRKHLSAINSIAVARSKESLRSLLDDGYSQYIVLNENISILVCRGCSSRFAVTSIQKVNGNSLTDIAREMGSFNQGRGVQRLNIVNISTNENPVYLKVVESKLDSDSDLRFITEFSLSINPLNVAKTSTSKYLGDGIYDNYQSVSSYRQKATLMISSENYSNHFGKESFKSFVRLANIEGNSWLVLAFPSSSEKTEEKNALTNGAKIKEFNFSTDITDFNSYALTKVSENFIDAFSDVKTNYKFNNYFVLSKNLLISSTQVSTTNARLDIFAFMRENVLCNKKCYFSNTPINQAFRINDEDAFANLKNESDDIWRKFTLKCPKGESLDFNLKTLIDRGKERIEVEAKCSSTSENKLEYDSNYIIRRFDDASMSCSPAYGDIGRLRRGFLPLYKLAHKTQGKDVEVYIRPKFEFGWVPLGVTLKDHTKNDKDTCWNEFFDPDILIEKYQDLQKIYDQRCDRNKFLHFIRSYRAYIQLYTHTSASNPRIKQAGKLPTLKYYRYLRGKFFAAKTNRFFNDYKDVKKIDHLPLDDTTTALNWLSKIHSLCGDQHLFLPAQLDENSTGLTFTTNSEGDVFLQETSQKGLAFNIDKVYYIEIFGFKSTKTPQMKLTVSENDMQSDHRNLFDFGFRPLLVPSSLGTGITDGVLVSSKSNNESKTAFRIWVRDDMRLKNKESDICP